MRVLRCHCLRSVDDRQFGPINHFNKEYLNSKISRGVLTKDSPSDKRQVFVHYKDRIDHQDMQFDASMIDITLILSPVKKTLVDKAIATERPTSDSHLSKLEVRLTHKPLLLRTQSLTSTPKLLNHIAQTKFKTSVTNLYSIPPPGFDGDVRSMVEKLL